jgi:hypothetical protein
MMDNPWVAKKQGKRRLKLALMVGEKTAKISILFQQPNHNNSFTTQG